MRFLLSILLIAVLMFTAAGCGGDDDDDDGRGLDPDDDDDTVSGDDDDDDDVADDDDDFIPSEIELAEVSAPDEYTVLATFTSDVGQYNATNIGFYSIDEQGTKGDLAILSIEYDPLTFTATLTTGKQKLGIDYEVTFTADGFDPTYGEFLAADTAHFWVIDFYDYSQYQIVADRIAVGSTCVIYVEQGWSVTNETTTVNEFDNNIYPTLTQLLTTPPDFDGNGTTTILGLDGGSFYGGYFDPSNALSDEDTMDWWGRHSNEMEIVHINVAYYDDGLGWDHTLPHEFQHLLYNKTHSQSTDYWSYHDEGLAEVAVWAVYNDNQRAIDTFQSDWNGDFANGLSLVDWQYANYNNYALAYLFWMYYVAQAGSNTAITSLFDIIDADPGNIDTLFDTILSTDFESQQLDFMIASWVQDTTGQYGYEGLLSFDAGTCPTVDQGTTSVDIKPYGGLWFPLGQASVDYPGTQGANIVYAGVNDLGAVDKTAPFNVDGGALIILNANQEYSSYPAEHSGPDIAAAKAAAASIPEKWRIDSPFWYDPPPVTPDRRDLIDAYRESVLIRIADSYLSGE